MGMDAFNAVGIIVKYKKGKGADYVLEMVDEKSLDLRTDRTLFDGVSTTEELIARFNDGFSDPLDEGDDFNTNVEDWDEGAYKKFMCAFSQTKHLILMIENMHGRSSNSTAVEIAPNSAQILIL